jgi:hypothetical protein
MRILIKAKMIANVKIEIFDVLWGGSEGCDKVCALLVRRGAILGA